MATGIGIGIKWGLGTTTGGSSGSLSGSLRWQTAEYSKTAEKATVENEAGETIQVTYFNQVEECTFESVPVASSGLSAAIAGVDDWGTKVTVVSDITPLNQTNWYVEEPKVKFSNKESAKYTCKLVRWPNIS